MSNEKSPRVAVYARASADGGAIARQLPAIEERLQEDGVQADSVLYFLEEGCSGSRSERPALAGLREAAARGRIASLYVDSPDRLSRRSAEQDVLRNEFARWGVDVWFLHEDLEA